MEELADEVRVRREAQKKPHRVETDLPDEVLEAFRELLGCADLRKKREAEQAQGVSKRQQPTALLDGK